MWNKINRWVNRQADTGMWIAGGLVLAAYVFHLPILFIGAAVMAGIPILIRAIAGLRLKTVGIEALVTIAVAGALIIGEFSEAGIVTFLFQFGNWLEKKTMRKTRSAIRELTEMAPMTAWRRDGDDWEEIDADEVEEDDELLVKTGGMVAVDGILTAGEGYFNEASITGEPVPRHRTVGDKVWAGTILDSGTVEMRAEKVGEDTTFARIIALVEEAQDAKSPAERVIDRFAKFYTPGVVVLAALVGVLTGNADTAITVLVLACPGALVIGAPIANVAGIGRGAKAGVLLKGGESLTTFAKTDTVMFDKTGTLTLGEPRVTEIHGDEGNDEDEIRMLIRKAAALEGVAEHPIAKAIRNYAQADAGEVSDIRVEKGMGIAGKVGGTSILAGSERYVREAGAACSEQMARNIRELKEKGGSVVVVAENGTIRAALSVADIPREGAKECVRELRKLGVREVVLLSGDHEAAALKVGNELGIPTVFGDLLPQDKLKVVKEYMNSGKKVTFVGDGVNDSPAITLADTGIAMGSGTDVAIECSDVVLIRPEAGSLCEALKIAKKTVRIMWENIGIAIGTVVLLLAGLLLGYIHMSLGMLIHEASILAVILNGTRILYTGKRKGEKP